VPRPKFQSYAKLNAWLEGRCLAYSRANTHPDMRDKTIWEVFEKERASLVPYVSPFDHCPAGDCVAICREGGSMLFRPLSPKPA